MSSPITGAGRTLARVFGYGSHPRSKPVHSQRPPSPHEEKTKAPAEETSWFLGLDSNNSSRLVDPLRTPPDGSLTINERTTRYYVLWYTLAASMFPASSSRPPSTGHAQKRPKKRMNQNCPSMMRQQAHISPFLLLRVEISGHGHPSPRRSEEWLQFRNHEPPF